MDLFSRLDRFGIIYRAGDERDIERLREHFGLVICLSEGRQVLLVRRGWTGCETSWRSSEGSSMRPCIANGENAVITFAGCVATEFGRCLFLGIAFWGCGNAESAQEALDIPGPSRLRAVRRARQEDTGMKRIWNIADHGGKHHDPVNGPPPSGSIAGKRSLEQCEETNS